MDRLRCIAHAAVFVGCIVAGGGAYAQVGGVLANLIGQAVGRVVGNAVVADDKKIPNSILPALAEDINKRLPVQRTKHLVLTRVQSGPGKRFTFLYKTPDIAVSEIDSTGMRSSTQLGAEQDACTIHKFFMRYGVTIVYAITDRDGNQFFRPIEIRPRTCI